jgi:hypothetical protein
MRPVKPAWQVAKCETYYSSATGRDQPEAGFAVFNFIHSKRADLYNEQNQTEDEKRVSIDTHGLFCAGTFVEERVKVQVVVPRMAASKFDPPLGPKRFRKAYKEY